MRLFLLIFSAVIAIPVWGESAEPVEKFMNSVVAADDVGRAFYPEKWSEELTADSLDINDLAHTNFPDGIAYGTKASKVVNAPYAKIKTLLTTKGGIFKVVSAVKTQRNFKILAEDSTTLDFKLAIKVPILEDCETQDHVKIFEDKKGRGILEWTQIGEEGDLSYNHGAVIAEPFGDKTKVFVIAAHLMKPENKIPWLGRGMATNFIKKHYSGYIEALEAALNP